MIGPDFPRLTATNHRITSLATTDYNCIAWATGDTTFWWQPGVHWPIPADASAVGIDSLVNALSAIEYELCNDGSIEPGFEKVALYGISSQLFYTHAARQLRNGKWTSKMGGAEDIEHDDPNDVSGGLYGNIVHFMRRVIKTESP